MTTEEPQVRKPRRRRRRRRRGGGQAGGDGAASEAAEPKRAPAPPEWQWRTFPVLFAFALGVLVMGIAWPLPGIGVTFFFLGLGGVAFGLAHILTRTIIARRRR